MRRALIGMLLLTCLAPPVLAQPAGRTPPARTPATASSRCEALAGDWQRYEMNLAEYVADGITDNSAPRATLREMRTANDLAAASITLELMRENRCTLPARAPGSNAYFSNALACQTAMVRATGTTRPPECERSTWTRAN